MTTTNLPSCRNLDIYRLVTLRGCKQLGVARSFGISTVRTCQIVSLVHAWVAQSLPEWFWKGRNDLRFLATLADERIRVFDDEAAPETVTLAGPSWTYKRESRRVSVTPCQSPFTLPNCISEALTEPEIAPP